MIKGIHHISMKCAAPETYSKARDFYCNILGLTVFREWPDGMLLDTGSGFIEIFCNGEGIPTKGAIRHFALLTDHVDALTAKIRDAGYEVFIEPNDVNIPSAPVYPIRMAFCIGPLGEEIELFQER